jgi:hypothetical protein
MKPVYHILPESDLKQHEQSSMCSCMPLIKDEEFCVLVVHNSWDGREGLEMAKEILK